MSGDSKNFSKSYQLDTSKPGTYTISLTGDVTDADGPKDISTSVTVTVAEKPQQPAQQPTQQPAQQPTQQQTQQKPAQPAATYTNTNKTSYVLNDGTRVRDQAVSGGLITSLNAGSSVQVTGIGSNGWVRVNVNGHTGYIRADLLTDTKPAEETKQEQKEEQKQENKEEEPKEENQEKSTNKALKDLVIENYKLTPAFNPDTTKYTLEVDADVEKLEVSPITQDEKAKVEVTGNTNLGNGTNTITVNVTAEDGTVRMYTIIVTKTNKEKDDKTNKLFLKSLEIKNATLTPSFRADETNYTIVVSDPTSIKAQDVVAVAEDKGVDIKVALSEDTESEERLITIMLEQKDDEETKTGSYQIVVKKSASNPIASMVNKKDNKIYYILGTIIGILLIFIIVIIVLLKKTSAKEYDDFDVQDEDELDDDYDYSLKNAIDEANTEVSYDRNQDYDEMVERSNVKSQILNPRNYNVFEDDGDGVGVDDKTKSYNFYDDDEEYDEDYDAKEKRRGKHF